MIPKKLNTVIFNLFRSFAPSLFNFGIAVLGVQHCGANNWGELVSVLIILFIFSFISNWGNQEYLIRAYSKKPTLVLDFYFSSLTTRSIFLVLSLILFFFYPVDIVLLSLALIVVQFIYNSFQSLVVYHQKFKQHLVAESIAFFVILFAVLYHQLFSVTFFLLMYLLAYLLKSVLLIFVLKVYPKKGMMRFDKSHILVAVPFFLIGLSGWMNSKVSIYIVDYFLTPSDLSQYQILITAFIMLSSISALIIQPFTKHIYRMDDKVIVKMRRLVGWIGFPIVIVGSWMIWYFLENYTLVHFETMIYLVMALSSFPVFFFTLDIFKYFKDKLEKQVMFIAFSGAAVKLILASILLPIYGIFGVVIGICCANWLELAVYKIKRNNYSNHKTLLK